MTRVTMRATHDITRGGEKGGGGGWVDCLDMRIQLRGEARGCGGSFGADVASLDLGRFSGALEHDAGEFAGDTVEFSSVEGTFGGVKHFDERHAIGKIERCG